MCKRLQWSGRRYDCRRISPHPLPRRFLCIHFDQVSSFFYKPPLYHAPVKLLDSSYTSSLCYDWQSIMLPAKSRKGQHAVKISCHEYKLDSKQIIGIRGNMATRKHSTANITRIVAEKEYVQCKLTLMQLCRCRSMHCFRPWDVWECSWLQHTIRGRCLHIALAALT